LPDTRPFLELDHAQERKHGQAAAGDAFLCTKLEKGERLVCVLADGLGSGVKASVLANLTCTMAARYMAGHADVVRAARTIMETLPVCRERRIAYSTFTMLEVGRRGETRVVEYDNPPFVLLRGGEVAEVAREEIPMKAADGRDVRLRQAAFSVQPGDRLVLFSDGVSQAGLGARAMPFGWGMEGVQAFLAAAVRERPGISARQLSRTVVQRALALDGHRAKDDISCSVLYVRRPREVLMITGCPVRREQDRILAELARDFAGHKVACGGSTAAMLARELGLQLRMELGELDPHVPPVSTMEGFDLVTEGALTLAALVHLLEEEDHPELMKPNAATRLAGVLLEGDIIHIVAGTKINEALQDPNLPADLDIRRNILRRLQQVLSERYLKDVRLRFI
jgi:serine/threonine protein phosphatase PrpC